MVTASPRSLRRATGLSRARGGAAVPSASLDTVAIRNSLRALVKAYRMKGRTLWAGDG